MLKKVLCLALAVCLCGICALAEGEAQFTLRFDEGFSLTLPEGKRAAMAIPTELLPRCPNCGRPLTMNLRADDRFVEDAGWHAAAGRYQAFLDKHREGKVLYLELGVGGNTPGIIKYPFWSFTRDNPRSTYACINMGEAVAPAEIRERSILIDADINAVLDELAGERS